MRVIQAILLVLACYVTFMVIARHAINIAVILKKGESSNTYEMMPFFEIAAAVIWLAYILVS